MAAPDGSPDPTATIAVGFVTMALGVGLLASQTGWLDIHLRAGQLWPFLLIALGFARRVEDARCGRRRRGGWMIFVGCWGLVNEFRLFGLGYETSWPLFVVAAGVAMVWRSVSPPAPHADPAARDTGFSREAAVNKEH